MLQCISGLAGTVFVFLQPSRVKHLAEINLRWEGSRKGRKVRRHHQFFASCWPLARPKIFELKGKASLCGGTTPGERRKSWWPGVEAFREEGEKIKGVFSAVTWVFVKCKIFTAWSWVFWLYLQGVLQRCLCLSLEASVPKLCSLGQCCQSLNRALAMGCALFNKVDWDVQVVNFPSE